MNQEETRENTEQNEDAGQTGEAKAETEAGEIDNLPVESIGSYARVEELLTDEEMDNTTRRDSES
ncbi:MAG TPA: hypothetical protein VF721_15490 [Pyrinomonadaceae bacterium]|jgi:hypothetical protein